MTDRLTYALIHSPLVGPLTWRLVRDEMAKRNLDVIAPVLVDRPVSTTSFWQQHAASLAQSLAQVPHARPIVLVAHSGAGPLLPVMGHTADREIWAYVFVDAGIPRPQASRLDLMRMQDPQWAERFHQGLRQGDRFPLWQEADLQEVIPDGDLRRQMVAEIKPRSLAFFAEPIPVPANWPDAPCAYIKFSPPYDWDFQRAKQAGWASRDLNAGHFHMLVDPASVTNAIVEVVADLEVHRPS